MMVGTAIVGYQNHAGVSFEESITPVVGECRADVESVIAPEVPGGLCRWFGMDDDTAPVESKRGGIEIEGACQVFLGGDHWLSSRLLEEVDCEFCVREEEIPSVGRKGRANAREDGNEMGLECSDHAFGGTAVVHVGWDQLVGAVPLVGRRWLALASLSRITVSTGSRHWKNQNI